MHYFRSFFFGLTLIAFPIYSDPEYTIVPDKALTPLLTPSMKERKTLKLVLANGLQAYLISDPNAEQSAATLVVETGSWEEPAEHLGLAHFLEHMLFLGTTKYPEEGGYGRFVSQNRGDSNAFTSNDATAFMFSINHNAFNEALDRFSSFFKEPLFNPSGVSRELHAIDQEYAKNIENDDFRMLFVLKALARPEHPESRFNIGNSQTLAHTSPDDLRDWFKTHYSANIMRLAVYSNLPLDELKKIVVNDFKDIPNNGRAPLSINLPITPKKTKEQIIFIEPVQNERKMTILWELPRPIAHMNESHPEQIVCHILGHEGKTSLLAELKRENLASGIACGILAESRDHHFLAVEIQLTEEGIRKFSTVIERLYQTLALLRKQEIPQQLVEEVQKQALLEYQFQEPQTAFKEAMSHAAKLSKEDLATYPEREELIAIYDPQAIRELLRVLHPNNARVVISAPEKDTHVKLKQKEKWLGVGYQVKYISKDIFDKWIHSDLHPNILLPEPNPFIPNDLTVLNSEAAPSLQSVIPPNKGVPKLTTLLDDDTGKVYYAQDTLYRVPKTNLIFTIRSEAVTPADPKSIVLSELYALCVQDSLDDLIYNAYLAGLNFSIKAADNWNGVRMQIRGYNNKADEFITSLLKTLPSPFCNEAKFERYRDKLLRSYSDKAVEMPIEQAIETMKSLLYKNYAEAKEKESALKNITFKEYSTFVKELYASHFIEGIIYGNLQEEKARGILKKFQTELKGAPYPPEKHFRKEILLLSDKQPPRYFESSIETQGNAVLLAIEAEDAKYNNRAAQQILMQAIQDSFFNTLRTQQQTGYIVFSTGEETVGQLLDIFGVQSNSHDTRDLLARFELFLESYLKEIQINEIPQVRFDIIKTAFIEQLRQPPKNLDEMAELINELAFTYLGAFDRPQKRIDSFENLHYADFISYAQKTLGHGNKRRLAILLNGIFPDNNLFHYERVKDVFELQKEGKFITTSN